VEGDPWGAVQALEKLRGARKRASYTALKKQIMADRGCSDTIAKEVIRKALNPPYRYIAKGENGTYKIRREI
jgi:hypothetical protein